MILPPAPFPFDELPEPVEESDWSRVFVPGYDLFDEMPEYVTYLCMLSMIAKEEEEV